MAAGTLPLKEPLLVINYKAYITAVGEAATSIARAAEKVSREYGVTVAVAPPATMINRIASTYEVPVFAQHVDPVRPGSHTGFLTVEAIKEAGAVGSVINHSEHRLKLSDIEFLVNRLREERLLSLVCADTPAAAAAVAVLRPDIIAIEPPELIGTGIPVSKAKPEVVIRSVRLVRSVNSNVIILTGAGITTGEDVAAAIRLGTSGVLVASAVMKAKEPDKVLSDMADKAVRAFEERGKTKN